MFSALITCPLPFPDWELTDNVKLFQTIETEDQGPQEVLIFDGLCKYDEMHKQVFNADSKLVSLSGSIVIKGEVQTINKGKFEGYVLVNEEKKQVYSLSKTKVMGKIFSTEIELK